MTKDWHGLIKILDIQHLSKDGEVIWQAKNLYNILHTEGEEFILKSMFIGGNDPNTFIPDSYYFGLDNRPTPDAGDTMDDLVSEPTINNYIRQPIASINAFTVSTVGGINQAQSPIVTFSASGGSWGPVTSLFLTDQADNSGFLIATVPLTNTTTLSDGEVFNVRMGLSLTDCITCP